MHTFSGVRRNFLRGGAREAVCSQDLAKGEVQPGVSQPPTNFCDFHIKTLILADFFIEKGHAVSAVTIDQCCPRLRALRAA